MSEKQVTVRELETYFRTASLPAVSFNLNPSHRINDVKIFLESHFGPLRSKELPLDILHRPLYDRLVEFKNYLETSKEILN